MKFINKILLVALVVAIGACDTELDLQDNPNAVTPENASVNDLYNNIQLEFNDIVVETNFQPGAAARMYHAAGNFTYQAWADPTDFNSMYRQAYADLFPDVDALIPLADAAGLAVHSGSAKIMKAYALMVMVDILGDIPNSQAGQGTDVISPGADSGADVYANAVALLDEAIGQMTGTTAAGPTDDIFYAGDAAKWVTLAKTLKLRAAVTMRLVGGGPNIGALISEGDLIDEGSEDFAFQYGKNRSTPDARHWMYSNNYGRGHYENQDGDYLSNSYMWNLRAEKKDADGIVVVDPRIRYYFYRKVDDAANQDPTTYGCNFSTLPDQTQKPSYYPDELPYCYGWEDGYSGRDHLNGQGIPPDGPVRTSYGLYPGGGSFDDNSFSDTRPIGPDGGGGGGAGISPIMLASYVDFLRAEAALTMSSGEDARALLESGIRKSMAKVESFESLVSSLMSEARETRTGNGTVKELYGMTAEDVDKYVNLVLDNYDNSSDKLDVVMKEYYIALWGNGLEAYNMYRRTGKPANMAPALEAEPGSFPRSFFYPSVYVNRNSSATQKADLTSTVFWDNGSATVY